MVAFGVIYWLISKSHSKKMHSLKNEKENLLEQKGTNQKKIDDIKKDIDIELRRRTEQLGEREYTPPLPSEMFKLPELAPGTK